MSRTALPSALWLMVRYLCVLPQLTDHSCPPGCNQSGVISQLRKVIRPRMVTEITGDAIRAMQIRSARLNRKSADLVRESCLTARVIPDEIMDIFHED